MKGYVGTYASKKLNGIYEFEYDENNDKFIGSKLYSEDQDAKYLSLYQGILAYPYANGVKMISDHQSYQVEAEMHVPCFITQDETYIYTANYHDGTIMRYEKKAEGMVPAGSIFIQKAAGSHQVILSENELIVPCRLLDYVNVYDRANLTLKQQIIFPVSSGPRHGMLSNDESRLYLVSENSCELFTIDMTNYQIIHTLPLLKHDEQGGGAAIRKSSDERFLYISVREINQIYVVDVKKMVIVQTISSGGDHPRDIALSPDEQVLFVANRFSDSLIAFHRDEQNGQLTYKDQLNGLVEGVSIVCKEECFHE